MNWHISTYSGEGNCVAVAGDESLILVKDTKDSQGAILRFTPTAWREFAREIRAARLESRQGSDGTSR